MAAVVVELSGDEAKLLKAYQKVRDAQAKMDDGLKKVKASSEKAGQAGEQAGQKLESSFGTRALSQIQSYATGVISVTGAMQMLRGAVNMLSEDSRRALETLQGITETGMRLNQILQGDALDAAGRERNRLAMQTGVKLADIQSLQFQAGSLGMSAADVEMLAMASGANLLAPDAATSVGGQVPLLFRESGVTPMQAVSGTLAAAAESPASFEEIGEFLPVAAEGAAQQRLAPAETIAATAVMREKFQMSTAAQRLNRFAANLAMDSRFQGMSLDASLNMLQAMSEEERNKFLGDSIQMQGAYRALVDLQPRIRERTAVVERAMQKPEDAIRGLTEAAIDPRYEETARNRARMQMERARREQDVQDLLNADRAATVEATVTRQQVRMQQRGTMAQQRYTATQAMELMRPTGATPGQFAFGASVGESISAPSAGSAGSGGIAAGIYAAVERMQRTADSMDRAASSLDGAADQQARQRAAANTVPE